MDVLTTERLELVRWEPEHDELLVVLSAQRRVVRYIRDGSTWAPELAREVAARNRAHWALHGFGWRPARLRETQELVGFVGLNLAEAGRTTGVGANEIEIGWWLDPRAQGRGYAIEGAKAVAGEAFGRLGAGGLLARIHPDNEASKRVARAVGLAEAGTGVTDGDVVVELFRSRA